MIDFHADTIFQLWKNDNAGNLYENSLSVSIKGLESIGALAQCFAIYTPPECGWQEMNSIHEVFVSQMKAFKDHIKQASYSRQILKNSLSAILTIEDMKPTEGDWQRVRQVISWKPRIVGLVWNEDNAYAYANSTDREKMARPLTEKGRQLAELLDSEDIIIDVSHLNDGGFKELAGMKVKIIATHSDSRSLVNHPRNLTDEMIRIIADRGGVVGLNFCPEFLCDDGQSISRISDMVRHVMHMRNVGGDEVIALGTDFDGIEGKLEISRTEELPRLFDALSDEGLPSSSIDRFRSGNALRILA